jgi:poly(3-hydroxybutyrate) depolymerase
MWSMTTPFRVAPDHLLNLGNLEELFDRSHNFLVYPMRCSFHWAGWTWGRTVAWQRRKRLIEVGSITHMIAKISVLQLFNMNTVVNLSVDVQWTI